MDEFVKHPKHYNSHPSGIECITIIEEMPANIAFAMKHLWRVGLKPGQDDVQDLRKAIEYVQFEIDRKLRRLERHLLAAWEAVPVEPGTAEMNNSAQEFWTRPPHGEAQRP